MHMVKRTKREAMYSLLENNPQWKVVDIASSNAGWKYADVFTDIRDYSKYYNKKYNGKKLFVRCDIMNTPFKDKEFDFIIASHILEHVINPVRFCNELARIGNKGYIEIPTPLWDNLVNGAETSKYGHKWWITFDDLDNHIVFNRKVDVVDKFLSMLEHNIHMAWFRDSIVTQLYWENIIDIKEGNNIYSYYNNRDIDICFDAREWGKDDMFKFGSK